MQDVVIPNRLGGTRARRRKAVEEADVDLLDEVVDRVGRAADVSLDPSTEVSTGISTGISTVVGSGADIGVPAWVHPGIGFTS